MPTLINDTTLVTDYIVWSQDPDYLHIEHVTRDRDQAVQKLTEYRAQGVPELHVHKVSGNTPKPLEDDAPIIELCLTKNC